MFNDVSECLLLSGSAKRKSELIGISSSAGVHYDTGSDTAETLPNASDALHISSGMAAPQ